MHTFLLFLRKFTGLFLLLGMLMNGGDVVGQVNITPERTDVSGFPDWIDTSVEGATYVQLLTATSTTITPAMDFTAYTNETLNFTARTFGGTNTVENTVTISISIDNGVNWIILGTRTPTTNTLVAQTPFDLSTYTGTQVRVRFSVAGTSNSIGVGIDDIAITGLVAPTGITSFQSGPWNDPSTWDGNSVPTSSQNAIIATNHLVTVTTPITRDAGTTTTVNAGGTLATNVTYTNNGNTTINGTFQINAGGFAGGTNDFVYGTDGNLIFNHSNSAVYGPIDNNHKYWPTSNSLRNITLNANSPINLGVSRIVATTFTTASGVTISSGSLTFNGICQINAGGFFSNRPIYGSASTLIYNSVSNYGVSNEWNTNAFAVGLGVPQNVTLTNSSVNLPATTSGMAGNLTIDANSTLNHVANGVLIVAGNWSNAGVFNANNGVVSLRGGAALQTITNTNSTSLNTETFSTLIVSKTGANILRLESNVNINGTTENVLRMLDTGALDLNGKILSFNNNGGNIFVDVANRTITSSVPNGIININGSKVVAHSGTGTLILGANVTVNLNPNGNLNFGENRTTLNGRLSINSTTNCFVNTNPPIYGNASTLIYNNVNDYGVSNEWTGNAATAGAGTPQNVTLTNSTVDLPNTSRALAGNLTIGGTSIFNMNTAANADLRIGGDMTVDGTFDGKERKVIFTKAGLQKIISSNVVTIPYVVFDASSSTTLELNCDLVISAPIVTAPGSNVAIDFKWAGDVFKLNGKRLTVGSSDVNNTIDNLGKFQGSTASDLILRGSGNAGTLNFVDTARELKTLTLDKDNGFIGCALGTNLTIAEKLIFIKGVLDLDSSTLTIGAGAIIENASSANFVIATGIGYLRKNFNTTGAFTFPIGTVIDRYTPATISFTTLTANGSIAVNVIDDKLPQVPFSPGHYINRYWNVTGSGIASDNYSFTGTYRDVSAGDDVVGTEANMFALRRNTTSNTWLSENNVDINNNTFSLTGMSTVTSPITDAYQFTAGSGIPNATSDIIEDESFSYTSNIDYTLFQSATIPTFANGVGAFRFIIRDGGATAPDADALATELTGITFNVANIANIRTARLYDNTTLINSTPTINVGAGTITFSGLNGANVTAADNSTKVLTLYVSFLTAVTDNQQLQYTVSSATTNAASSGFATSNAGGAFSSVVGDINKIEVTADRLAFVQQPSDTALNVAMNPAVTIAANDVNGNRDLDFVGAIEIISDGTLTGEPVSAVATNGLASFASLTHTAIGTNLQLLAGYTSWTVLSDEFDITTIVYVNGDYRSTGSGSWTNNNASPAIWQRLDAFGNWNNSNSPSYNTANNVYIRDGHTISTGNAFANSIKLKIMSGGTFNVGHPSTTGSINVYSGGILNINAALRNDGTFEVEDNGIVVINYSTASGISTLWNGTENFRTGSIIEIKNWNYGASAGNKSLIQNPSVISLNSDGYYFGNLTISGNLTGTFPMVLGNQTVNFCRNDFRRNATGSNAWFTSSSGNITVGGNVIVDSGQLSIAATNSGTPTVNILGNLLVNNGTIDLNQNITTAVSTLNLIGDLDISSGTSLFSNNMNSVFNFIGTGDGLTAETTQTVNVVNQATARNIAFNVKAGSYVKLINQDFALGTNSKFIIENGGIFDFGFNGTTPLNLVRVSGQIGQSFESQIGSVLKISSPAGISNGSSVYTGNVQIGADTTRRIFSPEGIFHYIGKANQVTGNGLPIAASNKHVIVELDSDNLEFTSSNGIVRFNNPASAIGAIFKGLEIRKGTVIADDNGNRFDDGATGELGNLKMSGGIYKIFSRDVQPAVSGNYDLSLGSKIIFAHTTATTTTQGIRGGASYQYPAIEIEGKDVRYSSTNINMKSNGIFTVKENAILTNTGSTGQIVSLDDANPATLTVKNTGIFKTEKEKGFSGVPDSINPSPSVRTSHTSGNVLVVLESGSTVDYSRAGNQTITTLAGIVENTSDPGDDDSNYSNLKLSGSGTKSFAGTSLKVGNELDVEGTALLPVLETQTLVVNKKIATVDVNTVINTAPNTSVDATVGILIKDSGSLVQIENPVTNVNTGNIQMERKTKPVFRFDYTYWSSPVQDFVLKSVSPTTLFDKFFSWNQAATPQEWLLHSMHTTLGNPNYLMEEGRGYIVRAPQGFPIETPTATALLHTANFVGKPNNGTVTVPVFGSASTLPANNKWNLLGNPYPSAIDATTFLNANTNLGGTLYFWTHNTSITSASPSYAPNDYASWNGTGATATLAGADGVINNNAPTGKIAAGQGFFVKGIADGTGIATFNNTMRVREAGENNQFFKGFIAEEHTTNTTPSEKHRVWLNIKGTPKGFNQLLVGYIENATNDYDNRFDGESFGGNLVTFYSINNTKNLVIQGRALPFINTDTVPLGYKTTLTGNLTISIDHVDGLMEDQDIYLQDNVLNVVHDLKASNYTFATVPGTFNSRFVLRYLPQEDLSNPSFDDQLKAVRIYKNEATLYVSSPYETIATVAVYDLTGRLVFERKNCNTNRFETTELLSVDQALIVKVTLMNGAVVSEKVAP
jgi:hypothetical protein